VAERGLVMSRDETLGRRAAYLTLGLAAFVVIAFLLVATNLAVLLASGAEPNVMEGSRQSAWLQWRGRFLLTLPWWTFLLPVAGWIVVLRLVWTPERIYLRKVGPLRLIAAAAVVALLSFVTAFSAITWAYWYYVEGWIWYLVPAGLLVAVGVVASIRTVQINRAAPKRSRRQRPRTARTDAT
jgi:hypothetical protein